MKINRSLFATKLMKLRKAKGVSIKTAAKQAGISMHTWVSLEYDRSETPLLSTVVQLAKYLDISLDELIKGTQHSK